MRDCTPGMFLQTDKTDCDISINNYIIEFENLNHLMENQNMKVLAFKLFDGAAISENQRQMCLTLANDLAFNSMKTANKHFKGYCKSI